MIASLGASSLAVHATDPVPRRLAVFFPLQGSLDPLFRDWLLSHRDVLFGWTMARGGDVQARRSFAETAVAIQRLRGSAEFLIWLYGAAVAAALRESAQGGLPETALSGLAPELRTTLRLVSRGELRPEEATALLSQRLGYVRSWLLQTRMRR